MMTAGAAPPAAVIGGMEALGFHITHVYGLTEVYGPAVVCAWHDEWDGLPADERARLKARQGVNYPVLEGLMVADPETLAPVPPDGATMGEIFMRGNIVMKGYLKNPAATEEAFAGGWFHTGDLAVAHPDGYIEIKDRSKDIIISGGENISTIEVEDVLYRHPAVHRSRRRRPPRPEMGRDPLRLRHPEGRRRRRRRRDHRLLPRAPGAFQGAAARHLRPVAEDLDRKDPEIRAARARQRQLVTRDEPRSLGDESRSESSERSSVRPLRISGDQFRSSWKISSLMRSFCRFRSETASWFGRGRLFSSSMARSSSACFAFSASM